jgi:thiol-disulfide isomerase/thioredoxin
MKKFNLFLFALVMVLLTSFVSADVTFKEKLNDALAVDDTIPVIQKGEIAVINIWATWCGPCIREIPELNELVANYKNKNVRFLAFSAEAPSVFETFKGKRPEFTFDYELSFANKKSIEMIMALDKEYQGRAIPLHVLINEEGEVANVFVGASPENIEKIKGFLALHAKG